MWDYDYIKNHYRLIPDDLIGQKELNADLKLNQHIELVAQFKYVDGLNADSAESMFLLTASEKIKEIQLTFSQGSVTV